jgi:hypothetical protein
MRLASFRELEIRKSLTWNGPTRFQLREFEAISGPFRLFSNKELTELAGACYRMRTAFIGGPFWDESRSGHVLRANC